MSIGKSKAEKEVEQFISTLSILDVSESGTSLIVIYNQVKCNLQISYNPFEITVTIRPLNQHDKIGELSGEPVRKYFKKNNHDN